MYAECQASVGRLSVSAQVAEQLPSEAGGWRVPEVEVEVSRGGGRRGRRGEGEANLYLCGLTDGVPAGQTDELLLLHVTRHGVNADLFLILPQG